MRADHRIDWEWFPVSGSRTTAVVCSRRRLYWCLGAFLVLLAGIFARFVQLEVTQGPAFRAEAAKPLVHRVSLAGRRGRILSRDGTVLACDRSFPALAVHYRYLQRPANPRWLRWKARLRLSPAERRNPARLRWAERQIVQERNALAKRLARLCGLSLEEWYRRTARIQAQVERIAARVNRRHDAGSQPDSDHQAEPGSPDGEEDGTIHPGNRPARRWLSRWADVVLDALAASPGPSTGAKIVVAEELDYHVMVEDVPLEVVAEIEGHPHSYPGVKIVERIRRTYPQGRLASHVLGYVGAVTARDLATGQAGEAYHPEDRIGRVGVERQYESVLRPVRGVAVELTDRSRQRLATWHEAEPRAGRDLVLTIDSRLQRTAENLLRDALKRRRAVWPDAAPAGGAILVLDVRTGGILAGASVPDFDPNLFAGRGGGRARALLSDPTQPLFNRAIQMAIPPGSVFKLVSALALLQSHMVRPGEAIDCRGYLGSPDQWRCALFRRQGVGHGHVDLADALCVSCNVFFFHHAGRLGPEALVSWALDLGFGQRTGVDLPGESAGTLPTPESAPQQWGRPWRKADTRLIAVGQGPVEVTPIQVARMVAAVANGGLLVTPHVAARLALPEDPRYAAEPSEPLLDLPPPRPIPGLDVANLAVIQAGMRRVVADPAGTAHPGLYIDGLPVAGKTGTAQTGPGRLEHAWFAGYLPADSPQYAVVVVLEHAGNAGQTACPVAKRLALAMKRLGLLEDRQAARSLAAVRSRQTPARSAGEPRNVQTAGWAGNRSSDAPLATETTSH